MRPIPELARHVPYVSALAQDTCANSNTCLHYTFHYTKCSALDSRLYANLFSLYCGLFALSLTPLAVCALCRLLCHSGDSWQLSAAKM